MRRMKGAAGLLTALLLAFQLSAQTFALANEDNGIKVVPVNFTHNGYSYEIEGVAKSTDGDYQIKSPARLAARKLPSTYDPRSSGEITTVKDQASTGACWAFSALACAEQDLIKKGLKTHPQNFPCLPWCCPQIQAQPQVKTIFHQGETGSLRPPPLQMVRDYAMRITSRF